MRDWKRLWRDLIPRGADGLELPRFQPTPAIRRHFLFAGRVQGVGFRFELMHLAERLGLTGWVCNRSDGSVEAEVQGEEARIAFLLDYMNSIRRISIETLTEEDRPLIPGESDFDVKWE